MLIDRTTVEDLSMLDLLVSKLEESMNLRGIKFFDYEKSQVEIANLSNEYDSDPFSSPLDEEVELKMLGPRPIKRIKLKFNSKADFHDRYSMNGRDTLDDGIYTASFLHIEWDYVTSLFNVYVGTNSYEKENNSIIKQRRMFHSNSTGSTVNLDFRFKYRREIQLIKIRLGKLYSKLVRDKKAEEERFARKNITEAAVGAFPDLLDPLILGGSLNEERNSARVPGERGSDSKDSTPISSGDISAD